MKVTFGPEPGSVIDSHIDSLSGIARELGEEHAADGMVSITQHNKQEIIARYSQMPDLLLWDQGGNFLSLLLEARRDYIEGKYWSCVAVCGMVIESLCRDIAKLRTGDPDLMKYVNDEFIHKAINKLKYEGCFWLPFTSKLMHDIMTDRNDYVHVKMGTIDSNKILNILVRTHLVVIAEYGLMPSNPPGTVGRVSEGYVKKIAADLKVDLTGL